MTFDWMDVGLMLWVSLVVAFSFGWAAGLRFERRKWTRKWRTLQDDTVGPQCASEGEK